MISLVAGIILVIGAFINALFSTTGQLPVILTMIIVPIAVVIVAYYIRSRKKGIHDLPGKQNLDIDKKNDQLSLLFNRYAGGHPDIQEVIKPCLIRMDPEEITFGKILHHGNIIRTGGIPIESVIDIKVESIFSLSKKLTIEKWKEYFPFVQDLGNLPDDEFAFMVITWERDSEIHRTSLGILGIGAPERALDLCNKAMKLLRFRKSSHIHSGSQSQSEKQGDYLIQET
jgi:hypothetical protein